MTLGTPEILRGMFAALSSPPPPESAGDFMAGTVGVVALLAILTAQEAESGAATRVAENTAIRDLFSAVLNDAGPDLPNRLRQALAAAPLDDDLGLTALDTINDALRRTLIDLHEFANETGDAALQGRILALLRDAARARRIDLPR
jgi:hypothetical protein